MLEVVAEMHRYVTVQHDCNGTWVEERLPPKGWIVEQEYPLTLRPSYSCGTCGLHGFITNGEWSDA